MPKYQVEIGLKGDTIEHVKEIEADNLDQAYDIAAAIAVAEYCIVEVTPLDDEGRLAAEFDELVKSIRSTMRMLSRNLNGELVGTDRAERYLRAMKRSINVAMKHAIEEGGEDD